jgi:hypothetical protein
MATTASGTALITGGSSGIGLSLAREFARAGFAVVLVARDAGRLAEQAQALGAQVPVVVQAIAIDLSRPGGAKELVEELDRRALTVDVLVNNAGIGTYGPYADSDLPAISGLIAHNIGALCTLTRLILPGMIARGQGRIMQVASTAAFQPGPLMAVYSATKAFVLSFSEALADELGGSGVTVTCLCPGATRTGFAERAGMSTSRLFQGALMDSDAVARAGFKACMAGRHLVIPGVMNHLLTLVVRFTPRRIVTRVVRFMLEQVGASAGRTPGV